MSTIPPPQMSRSKARSPAAPPLKFDQRLVLLGWMLSLFDKTKIEQLAGPLKLPELEGLTADNNHKYLSAIETLWTFSHFPGDVLLGYDGNIVRHTQRLNARRAEPIRWKYFQWLSLLFTEVYLDRLFRDPEKLLAELNAFVMKFNAGKSGKDCATLYERGDLRKLAFWNATGSGKTLLMHVNILQYRHYLKLHGREGELNRIILLTPNEGLSRQHLEEFTAAGMAAELFSKDGRLLFAGKSIEIIEVTKLRETTGEKTVAIDAFESNNLVLVDEGHRGASGKELGAWMAARRRLCENGFSFEYSATFGQAMKASGSKELADEYAKCILFDYSYKYFYRDGFGKDYRILNLADDSDDQKRKLYLTACLLGFYQQLRLFQDKAGEFKRFGLEKPLWVFVGGSVNAVRSENRRKVSDVVDILLFLAEFVKDKKQTIEMLRRLLGGKPGLHDGRGNEIFATAFGYLSRCRLSPEQAYGDILKLLFNAGAQASLHVENLGGTDGEIALRVGDAEPFGLINVGDASSLCKLCQEHAELLVVVEKTLAGSLFGALKSATSPVKVLIGSKKFTEGWNSYRVSTMGLMNVGKSEGSEIIQLFGRGVRLKGLGMSLKRSSRLEGITRPDYIGLIETLNIFGIRAGYMQQFKEYLEEEGLPLNEDRKEIILPVIKNLDGKRLTSIRLKAGTDFKRQAPKPTLDAPTQYLARHPIVVNWYPKIQAQQSRGAAQTADLGVLNQVSLEGRHLAFMDMDAIYFHMQDFKAERAWHNLNLPRENIQALLQRSDWYTLYAPAAEMQFTRFDRVRRWEEIAIALLKKYCDRYYKHRKQEWEADHLEYHQLQEDDPNFVDEYRLAVEASEDAIVNNLEALGELLKQTTFSKDWSFGDTEAIWFSQHLYQPLMHCGSAKVQISPVALNEGERDFVLDLRKFYEANKDFFAGRELYLLRNMSRGRGIGFFEAGNFYPDFIVWVLEGDKQCVNFVDPKGIRNLQGLNDLKIEFHKTIKTIESRMGNPNVILNSFIISNTPLREVTFWNAGMQQAQFESAHVLFQKEDRENYIRKLLERATHAVQTS